MRLSNFLLWQLAYAEIYVTQTLWPDFAARTCWRRWRNIQNRERRYGGVNDGATLARRAPL